MRDEEGRLIPTNRVKVEANDEVLMDENNGTRYIKRSYEGFSAEGCRMYLQSLIDMGTSALEEFDKAETDGNKLDIVGAVTYALMKLGESNMDTFRAWHEQLTAPELAATINEEVKDLLGKDVDVESMSVEEIEELMREVVADAAAHDINVMIDEQEK